jgi:hypothetical protein
MVWRTASLFLVLTFLLDLGRAQTGQSTPAASDAQPTAPLALQTTFRIRYVTGASVYLVGGRNVGLSEGTKLVVQSAPVQVASPITTPPLPNDSGDSVVQADDTPAANVADLKVVAVAETSAVCEVVSSTRPLAAGDVAMLPRDEIEKLVEKHALSNTRSYPAMVSFTEGDPMDEDVRDLVPRPPLPEINRAQGQIGFSFSTIHSGGQFGSSSSTAGLVLRADVTRINGTHWNLSGYWRGDINSLSNNAQPTIQDLINRTYHMSLTYVNPESRWVAGVGRLYLPWATSLNTIDGGYFGRRLSERVTAGIFAGSSPDPTSWSYDPNRRVAGEFTNITGGSYDDVYYSSTFGFGVSMLKWSIDRPFAFTENTIDYKRLFTLYEAMTLDAPHTGRGQPAATFGVGSSFITVRVQPVPRVSFDINHTYFRDVPTYDPQLVGTGLLDKYLFQGFSGGVRIDLAKRIAVYTEIGRSSVSGDAKSSWNTMYGITFNDVWKTRIRLDARFSNFNSPFAQGYYRVFSASRVFHESLQFQLQAGMQSFFSPVSKDSGSRFVNAQVEFAVGRHYFLDGGFTVSRGAYQNYNQVFTTFGYRFDNRWKREITGANHN